MALMRGALSHLDRCPGDVRVVDAPHVHRGPPCVEGHDARRVNGDDGIRRECCIEQLSHHHAVGPYGPNRSACSLILMKPGMERRTARAPRATDWGRLALTTDTARTGREPARWYQAEVPLKSPPTPMT